MSKFQPFPELILQEDDNLIFINKPAGISSLDERSGDNISIVVMAKRYDENAQLCHRIDKETSGVLVIARNADAYRDMSMLFEARQVDKTYHAVVDGHLEVQQKSIMLPLSSARNGLSRVDVKEGKPAETIVSTLKNYGHFTLVECKPVTGRLHQIRVHLASQNFPLAADTSYGGRVPYLSRFKQNFKTGKFENEHAMIRRVVLHAYNIRFNLNGTQYDVTAPYPKDFDVFLKQLDRFDPA